MLLSALLILGRISNLFFPRPVAAVIHNRVTHTHTEIALVDTRAVHHK